jgi:uncharacterized membrane protein YhaH (DUF805 family)
MDLGWFLFSFNGRINRKPYWIFLVLMVVLLAAVEGFTGDVNTEEFSSATYLVSLLSVWPTLAVQAKRWHDVDRSAWWLLINLVPFIGGIWVLIVCGFFRGTRGMNRFGPDPLGNDAAAVDVSGPT